MNSRASVFIDAANLWKVQKSRGKNFDYAKLKEYLGVRFKTQNLEIFYYEAYPQEGTRNYGTEGKQKFFVFLKKSLNFRVVKKPLKRIVSKNEKGELSVVEKGNMDVEMTIDAVDNIKKYNIAILFTGDPDFLPLVLYMKKRGRCVYVFSSRNNISSELRTGSDGYFDILHIQEDIWRDELKHGLKK